MGWHETLTWQEGHSNTHGVDNGAGNDPFNCNGAQTSTNLCGEADDRNWSRILLTQRVEQTNGVSSTWSYQYYLQGLTAKPCGNCVWGNTWGNQNDADTADYYNAQFTSYASAVVTNPDQSSQVDYFASTPGWGLATSGSTTTSYGQSYSYDALDRTTGPAGTVTYSDPNHIHAATTLSTVPNPYASYDAMGQMTCRTTDTTGAQSCAAGTQTGATLGYDNMGRLINWTGANGLQQNEQYLSDNEGNRVLRRSNTSTNGTTSTTDTITFDGLSEVSITGGRLHRHQLLLSCRATRGDA